MLNDSTDIIGNFGKLRKYYAAGRKPYPEEVIAYIGTFLPRKKFALGLDVGCGTGLATRSIARPDRYIIGVDKDTQMLEYAIGFQTRNVSFAAAAAELLPFSDRQFDFITAFGTFHWWWNVPGACKSMKRVLKPEGSFVVVNKNDTSPFRITLRTIISEVTSTMPSDKKKAYDPVKILEEKGWQVTTRLFESNEEFNKDELWNQIRSMSVWNAVTLQTEHAVTQKIEEYIAPRFRDGKFHRPISVNVVVGRTVAS